MGRSQISLVNKRALLNRLPTFVVCKMLLQIQHDLGLALDSAAAAEAHAIKLLKLYQHSLSLCKGLDPKEKAPGDDLIPLAVASLMAARKSDRAESTGSASTDLRNRLIQKRIMQVTIHILSMYCTTLVGVNQQNPSSSQLYLYHVTG